MEKVKRREEKRRMKERKDAYKKTLKGNLPKQTQN